MTFSFGRIVEYVSSFCTLEPGDIIFTGTPAGSGARIDPPRYLSPAIAWKSLREASAFSSTASGTNESGPRSRAEQRGDAGAPAFLALAADGFVGVREAAMRFFRPSLQAAT